MRCSRWSARARSFPTTRRARNGSWAGSACRRTACFGIPELIEDGANGLLCEPADLDSLTDGIRRLVSIEPGDAAELGRAGFEAVRSRDTARYAASVRSIFERLLEGAGTPLRG